MMISIIITTYKRPMNILQRALNTAYNQTVEDKEIILVNDYPQYKPDILTLIRNYSEVKFISHERNEGACKSRNDGIDVASGEYIAFLDDDDEWDNEKLARQLKIINSEKADMVYCSGVRLFPNGKIEDMPFIRGYDDNLCQHLLAGNFMGGCSFPLIKKSVLLNVHGFDEELPSSQDYDLWIRIARQYKVAFLNEPLVLYHVENASISSSLDRRLQGYAMVLNKHIALFKKHPVEMSSYIYNMARTALLYGRWDAYFSVFMNSFNCFPRNLKIVWLGIEMFARSVVKRFRRQ